MVGGACGLGRLSMFFVVCETASQKSLAVRRHRTAKKATVIKTSLFLIFKMNGLRFKNIERMQKSWVSEQALERIPGPANFKVQMVSG